MQPTLFCKKSSSITVAIDDDEYNMFEDTMAKVTNDMTEEGLAAALISKTVFVTYNIETHVVQTIEIQ